MGALTFLRRRLVDQGLKENCIIKSSAPGKIILSGEHSVVYGYPALASSISLRCHATIRRTGQTKVGLNLLNKGKFFQWTPKLIRDTFKKSANLDLASADFRKLSNVVRPIIPEGIQPDIQKACVTFLSLYHTLGITDVGDQGFDLTLSSDIPIGRGFGTSSAFSNAIIGAMWELGYKSETIKEDLLLDLGYQCERIHHGTPSGLDNTVSALGGGIFFKTRCDFERFAIDKLSVVVVDTKVVGNTAKIVASVRDWRDKAPEIVKPIMQSIGAISERMVKLLRQQSRGSEMIDELAILFRANQGLLLALGAGHQRIVEAQAIGERHNIAFKISGAGAGGILIGVGELTSKLRAELEENGFGVQTSMFETRGLLTETTAL